MSLPGPACAGSNGVDTRPMRAPADPTGRARRGGTALVLGCALFLLATACTPRETAEPLAAHRQRLRETYPTVRQLSTAELAAWLDDTNRPPPRLLDVRETEEFRISHLPGAEHVEPDTDATAWGRTLKPETPVVVYCSVGERSCALAQALQQAGHTNVVNLDGSIFQWANEGRPLYRGTQRTQRVHPYDRTWGRLLRRDLHGDGPR